MQNWIIGVILSIGAAFSASLGDNLVKYSFKQGQAMEADGLVPAPLYKRPTWLMGNFCMMVLNTALGLASYAFIDASIGIPFGGLHICFNIPLARYLNNEHCSNRALGYNAIIMCGVMVVLITGNHESNFHTTKELQSMIMSPLFLFSTIAMFGGVGFLYSMMKSRQHDRRRIGITVLCGIIGSMTQVLAKTMSECLKDGAWGSLFTWCAILLTIVCALTQVYTLNLCLDRYAAFFVVPIVNSTIIVFGSLYAAIYFQEIDRWSFKSRVFVPFGIFQTALGIALLSTEPDKEVEDHVVDDDDDVIGDEDTEIVEPLVGANNTQQEYVLMQEV